MDPVRFWKNFTLGEELHIAGRFIYNGLRAFHEIDTFQFDDEVFEVFYNLSVGLERLLKVAVILVEHDDSLDREVFERSLITHTHHDLLNRLIPRHAVHIAGAHNDFLQMLSTFHKSQRYGRYGTGATLVDSNEKKRLHKFFEKHLKLTLATDVPFDPPRNTPRLRRFLGKIVGKIVTQLYDIIRREADRLKLYTWELRTDSKADKIFGRMSFDFVQEDVLYKELLLFFVHSKRANGHIGMMKKIGPLKFDPGLEEEYLQSFGSEEKKLKVLDELEALYDELSDAGDRLDLLNLLGSPCVIFGDELESETDQPFAAADE